MQHTLVIALSQAPNNAQELSENELEKLAAGFIFTAHTLGCCFWFKKKGIDSSLFVLILMNKCLTKFYFYKPKKDIL